MNVQQLLRKARIGQIRETIIQAGKEDKTCSHEKLVLAVMGQGIARRTAIEYVNSVIDGNLIIRDNDLIFVKEDRLIDDILEPKSI